MDPEMLTLMNYYKHELLTKIMELENVIKHQILINCRSLRSMNRNERMPFQVFIIWVKFSPNLSGTQVFTQLSSYQWILLLVYTLIVAKLTYEKVNIVRVNLNNISLPWKEIQWGSGKSGSFQVSATGILIESHSTECRT